MLWRRKTVMCCVWRDDYWKNGGIQQEVCLRNCEQSSSDAVLHENTSPDDALELSTI